MYRPERSMGLTGYAPAAENCGVSLAVDAVSKSRGGRKVLDGVSLALSAGEFFSLLGPSGCGKTTLLRLIAGFEQPDGGRILLGGEDVSAQPANRRPVNTVFQNYALFPHMTVAGNVAFGLDMLGKDAEHIRRKVGEMLELVRLSDLADRPVTALSGGQQQRVALARALAPNPRVLLLDEPLSALDKNLRQAMQMELREIQRWLGITFVFVTHDQEEALAMSDRIAVMNGGRILQVGAPHAVYDAPGCAFVAGFLGETSFLEGRLRLVEGNIAHVELASGARVAVRCAERPPVPGKVTLAIRPQHVRFAAGDPDAIVATLETTSFLGTDRVHRLRLSDGTCITMRERATGGSMEPQPGACVSVVLPAERLRIVETQA